MDDLSMSSGVFFGGTTGGLAGRRETVLYMAAN